MLFRLFSSDRQLFFSIPGVIGRNGKVYFYAEKIAMFIGQQDIELWANEYSTCRLGEIFPDCGEILKNIWMIEKTALIHFLGYHMLLGGAEKEERLYTLLKYSHFRSIGQVRNFYHLEACYAPNGKLLDEHLTELQANSRNWNQEEKGKSALSEVVTRKYAIHLHKRLHGIGFKKRALRINKEIRKFGEKQMGTPDVWVDTRLNMFIWYKELEMYLTESKFNFPVEETKMKIPFINNPF